jgi:hypothetical protein
MADVLLDRSHQLDGTGRVRLRLARPRDRESLDALLEDLGVEVEHIDALRLLRCTPGRCLTIVRPRLGRRRERLVGVGHLAVRSGDVTLLSGRRRGRRALLDGLRDPRETWARRVA